MKKVLITDFLFVEAHRKLNLNLIDIFSRNYDVTVININGYYKNDIYFEDKNIKLVSFSINQNNSNAISRRISSIKMMYLTYKEIKKNKYDFIVVNAFDTIAFAIGYFFLRKEKIGLFHHKNIDELSNKTKMTLFNIYKNKVYHFVFEDFFRKHLINDKHVKTENCYVIPHPIELSQNHKFKILKKYDCAGLCNSNSEEFINNILKMNNDFKKNNLNILIRSKKINKSKSNIDIIHGFLESDVYYGYIEGATNVLVPVPENYIYRLSGSIYDAIAHRKIVLTTSKYYGDDYGRRYPGICYYISDEKQLLKKMMEIQENDSNNCNISFDSFINDHSIQCIAQIVKTTLEIILI